MTVSTDQLGAARFIVGILLAGVTVFVWIGVRFENEKYSKRTQEWAWRLLVRSLAAEAALTFFLLAIDTTITRRQEETIGSLKVEAARLAHAAEKAKSQIAIANAEAAKAQARANLASLAEARLRQAVIWRQVTPAECATIVAKLGGIRGTLQLELLQGDPEVAFFSLGLAKCFGHVAHWQVAILTFSSPNGLVAGLWLSGSSSADVQAVADAFNAVGFRYAHGSLPPQAMPTSSGERFLAPPDITLAVGAKPLVANPAFP
jgi:hypothetical protein